MESYSTNVASVTIDHTSFYFYGSSNVIILLKYTVLRVSIIYLFLPRVSFDRSQQQDLKWQTATQVNNDSKYESDQSLYQEGLPLCGLDKSVSI